jgi:DNA-binding PadR family transcriptional regulator
VPDDQAVMAIYKMSVRQCLRKRVYRITENGREALKRQKLSTNTLRIFTSFQLYWDIDRMSLL